MLITHAIHLRVNMITEHGIIDANVTLIDEQYFRGTFSLMVWSFYYYSYMYPFMLFHLTKNMNLSVLILFILLLK